MININQKDSKNTNYSFFDIMQINIINTYFISDNTDNKNNSKNNNKNIKKNHYKGVDNNKNYKKYSIMLINDMTINNKSKIDDDFELKKRIEIEGERKVIELLKGFPF
jgi:hypothetical protein